MLCLFPRDVFESIRSIFDNGTFLKTKRYFPEFIRDCYIIDEVSG